MKPLRTIGGHRYYTDEQINGFNLGLILSLILLIYSATCSGIYDLLVQKV
ncbi:MAG: hypothetical protein O4803_14365, partial [Trichodesmium sp. St15_bin1_1]|nr:hypothetical protein [Trichodesmium sp. St15_bin1_1]